MRHEITRRAAFAVAVVLLATCIRSAPAADLRQVVQRLEERARRQDPVYFKYTLENYMSPAFLKIALDLQERPKRDLQFKNSVEYARKGDLVFQRVTGPKLHTPPEFLVKRDLPSIYFFDGKRVVSFEQPQYIRFASSLTSEGLLHVSRPSDISGEGHLLQCLQLVAKGEQFDLVDFKDDELIEGERLCRIEFRAKETKYRTRVLLYPALSYAVKSFELINPDTNVAVWKHDQCAYQVIDGIAYLKSGTIVNFGGPANARYPGHKIVYQAESIETNPDKFPDFKSKVKVDPKAIYYDVDSKSHVTAPEQIQPVLDTIARLSKISGRSSSP